MAVPYPDMTGGTGVVPMTVEPLHQWEMQGLQSMANPGQLGGGSMNMANQYLQQMVQNPSQFAAQYTNPMATDYMGRAGDYTTQGAKAITMDEIQGLANPFTSAVKNRLTEAGQKAQAALLANQGMRGARSFGDTSQGVRQGMIDQEMLSKSADIDYQGYNDARGWLDTMRNRTMQAGGQFGNLAGQAQGITNSANQTGLGGIAALFNAGQGLTDQGFKNIQNQIGAGQYVRNYNQGINDLIANDMTGENSDQANKISQIMNYLSGFQSNTQGATPGANSMSQGAFALDKGAGLLNYFASGDPLDVVPDGGGYGPQQPFWMR